MKKRIQIISRLIFSTILIIFIGLGHRWALIVFAILVTLAFEMFTLYINRE